jgi:hypothetical protein
MVVKSALLACFASPIFQAPPAIQLGVSDRDSAGTMAYQAPTTMSALKEYVQGSTGMLQADSTVLVHVSHNHLKARFAEIRLDLHVSNLNM